MNAIKKIIYPCPDDTMGDTSETNCEHYREWITKELESRYPGADVTVTSNPGRILVYMSDGSDPGNAAESVVEFANLCWNRCPWDF